MTTPCTTCNSLTCSCLCPVCGDTPGHCACAPRSVCAWCGVSVLDGAELCAVCATPDARAVAFAGAVVLPALTECMRRRVGRRTVVAAVSEAVDAAFTDLEWNAYDVVQRVGCLAMFVSLGSLAAVARGLAGA